MAHHREHGRQRSPDRRARSTPAVAHSGEAVAPGACDREAGPPFFRPRVAVPYACIADHPQTWPVAGRCDVWGGGRRGLYADHRRQPVSALRGKRAVVLGRQGLTQESGRRWAGPAGHRAPSGALLPRWSPRGPSCPSSSQRHHPAPGPSVEGILPQRPPQGGILKPPALRVVVDFLHFKTTS